MAFKARQWEIFILLALVLADELAPVVKITPGRRPRPQRHRELADPGPPVEWLLYSRFAVILTLTTTYHHFTTIPIYAAMKAVEPSVFEAALAWCGAPGSRRARS